MGVQARGTECGVRVEMAELQRQLELERATEHAAVTRLKDEVGSSEEDINQWLDRDWAAF